MRETNTSTRPLERLFLCWSVASLHPHTYWHHYTDSVGKEGEGGDESGEGEEGETWKWEGIVWGTEEELEGRGAEGEGRG